MPFLFFLFVLSAVSSWGQPQSPGQIVNLLNHSGLPNALIAWGDYGAPPSFRTFSIAAQSVLTASATTDIGDVKHAASSPDKVVSFTADRAPGYTEGPWPAAAVRTPIDVKYPPVVSLKVRVWVLCASKDCDLAPLPQALKDDIMIRLAEANDLFLAESAGILLDLSDPAAIIKDETTNIAKKTAYQDFNVPPCSAAYHDLIDNGMIDPNALNLYFVRTVENSLTRGTTCNDSFPNVAIFGFVNNSGLIAHEIGHCLRLSHSDNLNDPSHAAYGKLNIMHPDSITERKYFSEGEVYRMHFELRSVLNQALFPFSVPPSPRTNVAAICYFGPHPNCPPIGLRLWDDPK